MMHPLSRPMLLRPGFLVAQFQARGARPRIAPKTVDVLLAAYGLTSRQPPQATPGGQGRSRSVLVCTDQGKKLLKQYKRTVTLPAIRCEHSILTQLAAQQFPSAPRLVCARDGETLVTHAGKHYALYDFIEGGFQYYKYVLAPRQALRFMATAAGLLADLHTALAGVAAAGENPNGFSPETGKRLHDVGWYLDKLERCVNGDPNFTQPSSPADLWRRAGDLRRALRDLDAKLGRARLTRALIHGDYGPHNLLFRPHAPVIVLDFELARLDWRALEVANALWRFCYGSAGQGRLTRMRCFLQAYQERAPLTPEERRALPDLWQFSHVRRCIYNWNEYLHVGDAFTLAKARRHLRMLDWMQTERALFCAALGVG